MQRYAEAQIIRMRFGLGRLRRRDPSHPRDNRPANGTYRDDVAAPIDPSVARARFATFVSRALADARAAGATDRSIAAESGVATSTFHRWRLGQGRGLPEIDKVRRFCAATGADLGDALRALGVSDEPAEPTPEPPLPRDVRIILRRLADPATPASEAEFIRMTLQMLAARATSSARAEGKARDAS